MCTMHLSGHSMYKSVFSYLLPFTLSFISWAIFFAFAEEWFHCTTLDGQDKFHVCWTLLEHKDGDREIEFRLEVEAHGYVGFGLSPNGGMASSDIVTGWITDGQTHFQDRHGVGNILPEIDVIQNWNLISGSENDTHTVLTIRRKLETCDKEDRNIDDSTTRLIYAYSDEDPPSENGIQYHFKQRGSKSALLLQLRRPNLVKVDKSSLSHWDVLSPNFTLPSRASTMYWCKIYRAPDLSQKNHIVLVEPVIQEGNEGFVHHLLLYECVGADPEEYNPYIEAYGHQCHHPNMPDAMKKCEGVFLAWGVGGEYLVLPQDIGIPLEPSPSKYYMMEMHYDNPSQVEGVVDRSGLRIYYTPKLRKFDAGTLMIGSTVSTRLIVPPRRKEYVIAGHSNPACLDPEFPEDGIKLLGIFLHAHLLGRRLKARHYRKFEELPVLADDKSYDFNYQEYRYYTKEVSILPGDQITVECTYDSSDRNETTFGGESTREEMCLAFLLYYPRIERFASVSVPKIDVINAAIGTNLTKSSLYRGDFRKEMTEFDWSKVDIYEVEKSLRYGVHDTHCYLGNGVKNTVKTPISYPEILRSYKTDSPCLSTELLEESQNGGQELKSTYSVLLTHCCLCIVFSVMLINI